MIAQSRPMQKVFNLICDLAPTDTTVLITLKENVLPRNSRKAYLDRVAKETIHELGHTFSLRHCPDPTCLMHYCHNTTDVDRKSGRLCRYCTVQVGDALEVLKRP